MSRRQPTALCAPPILLLGLVLLATLAACAPDAGEEAGEPAERRFLSLGTAPPGGAFFVVGSALAEVLSAHQPDWQVAAEATKGTQENLRRLASGELDAALANSAISYFAVRGEGGWGEAMPVRAVMTLAPNVAFFVTPADSGVETIADLRDERVVVGPAGAGFEYFLEPILAAHGVSYDDFTPLNATQAGAVDLLADGSAAAAFLGGAVPTASVTQASTSQDVRFVPFDERALEGLVERYPFFERASFPAGTYRGQEEEFRGLDVGSMHLVTSAEADEELVYQVTKTLWEHRDEVVAKHPAGRAIQRDVVVRDTGTPFHPGAVRFYRELGIWSDEGRTTLDGETDGSAEAGTASEEAPAGGQDGGSPQ